MLFYPFHNVFIKKVFIKCFSCLILFLLINPVVAEEPPVSKPIEPATPEQIAFFETHVRPLLVKQCISCHGPKKQHAELRLDSRAAMIKGGESGAAISPFNPNESLLIEAVRRESFEMPPEDELTEEEIAIFTKWVEQGAVWPKSDLDNNTEVERDFDSHWAFQPISDPEVPKVKNSAWPINAIDHFVLAKLEESGLAPAPVATRATLLRRMKWDLVGLPLTSDESKSIDQQDTKQIIDQLLNSPHYGERWGRYWLDLARYADTKGYVFFEKPKFHNGYTYRDYVIQSFNEDKPYNQFVKEQLAADLMQGEVSHQAMAGLGFVTIGPHLKNELPDILADRIDVVSRGFLGLTVGCARCHDHKFDPVSMEDYYSLYGVFHNSLEPIHLPFRTPDEIPAKQSEQAKQLEKAASDLRTHYDQQFQLVLKQGRERLAEYLAVAQSQRSGPDTTQFDVIVDGDDLSPQLLLIWQQYLEDRDAKNDPVFLPWNRLAQLEEADFTKEATNVLTQLSAGNAEHPSNQLVLDRLKQKPLNNFDEVVQVYIQLIDEIDKAWRQAIEKSEIQSLEQPEHEQLRLVLYGTDSPLQTPMHGFKLLRLFPDRQSQKKVNELNAAVDAARAKAAPELAQMLVMKDAETIVEPRIFKRGNAARPAEYVTRRYLQYFDHVSDQPFVKGSGRLELAEAIVSPDNPLTARVIVNRIWQHHFGEGLVTTPSDFGMQSQPPSHPELLDHLATWFTQHNGSIKQLHRYIMQSATYRQASQSSPEGEKIDPANRLLWKMNRRRMDLETMRDALLAVSDSLDLTVGGPSVAGAIDGSNNRRTLYTHIDRQKLPGVMRMFDFPPPDVSTATRNNTIVPGQALFLMNHPMVLSAAKKISDVAEFNASHAAGIAYLFRKILGREPELFEIAEMLAYLETDAAELETPEEIVKSSWQYGYGVLDEPNQKLTNFTPLTHWTGDQFQGGVNLPDKEIGWVFLNASGGHPGNNLDHVAVIRWTAPAAMTVSINGIFKHDKPQGDGVRGRILAAGKPLLGPWKIHQQSVDTNVDEVTVKEGETIDFIVDIFEVLSHDSFEWIPQIEEIETQAVAANALGKDPAPNETSNVSTWNYGQDFHGPKAARISAWQNLAHVLLLSNEFQFID
ncbi:MAG: hypothetical protein COA78_11305 [Blastopirellula sp.]|nr:MAG: hypothetical protein COA78_11305 [Blastopirellula sp.]